MIYQLNEELMDNRFTARMTVEDNRLAISIMLKKAVANFGSLSEEQAEAISELTEEFCQELETILPYSN